MIEDEELKKITETEIKNLAINSYSCIKEKGKKINYITYIKEMKNKECNEAIKRIFPHIKLNEINNFINNIEEITTARKEFYRNIIEQRYNIIEKTYKKL